SHHRRAMPSPSGAFHRPAGLHSPSAPWRDRAAAARAFLRGRRSLGMKIASTTHENPLDPLDQQEGSRKSPSPKAAHVFTVEHRVHAADRARMNGHLGGILWFTGLSGSGKSTLAVELERVLFARGYQVFLLDGDNLRRGPNADLGFSPEER